MPLPRGFYPKYGHVLLCDFERGFVHPEMVKRRQVVVISPTSTNYRRLCTVVPISATPPQIQERWHCLIDETELPWADDEIEHWAKCDMMYTVSFDRLDKFHRKTRRGGREYFVPQLTDQEMVNIALSVNSYLDLVEIET